ncbi:MAG: hypothetical protein DRP87_07145 [Spirochaetes bacterium]|nr:MAG: hypothetical protein DRP87_07145 [Spirochaetota bacterium]
MKFLGDVGIGEVGKVMDKISNYICNKDMNMSIGFIIIGIIGIVLALPLYLGKIKLNRLYGYHTSR